MRVLAPAKEEVCCLTLMFYQQALLEASICLISELSKESNFLKVAGPYRIKGTSGTQVGTKDASEAAEK